MLRLAVRRILEHVANLAERQQLPDAEIREGALKVTPLHRTIPAAAEALVAEAYSLLPQVRVTGVGAGFGDGRTIAGENSHSRGFMSGSETGWAREWVGLAPRKAFWRPEAPESARCRDIARNLRAAR